jgi:hypothetical protein
MEGCVIDSTACLFIQEFLCLLQSFLFTAQISSPGAYFLSTFVIVFCPVSKFLFIINFSSSERIFGICLQMCKLQEEVDFLYLYLYCYEIQ